MSRRALLWSALNDAMPLYAVYALVFSDAGLSTSRISLLFVLWSATVVLLEIPTGALADRFSPGATLVSAGVLRALGYALWIVTPNFAGFATGFVLWGTAGALESGSFESLLYAGLHRQGVADRYASVIGRSAAVARVVEVGATLAAAPLLALGGTNLVGWVSVGVCLVGSLVATGFPVVAQAGEPCGPDEGDGDEGDENDELGYFELLRLGVGEAWSHAPVRRLVILSAFLFGLTAVDEYVPLLVRAASIPESWIPAVLAALPLAAAGGNALAGRAARAHPSFVVIPTVVTTTLMIVAGHAGHAGHPALLPLLGLWWLVIHSAMVVADARLQEAVTGPARATVTSVAGLGSELAAIVLYLAVALASAPR